VSERDTRSLEEALRDPVFTEELVHEGIIDRRNVVRCRGCGYEAEVVERMWLGRDPYLTTSDPDQLPLGADLCKRCWWKQRLREIDEAS
jgi:hypothetical protein